MITVCLTARNDYLELLIQTTECRTYHSANEYIEFEFDPELQFDSLVGLLQELNDLHPSYFLTGIDSDFLCAFLC